MPLHQQHQQDRLERAELRLTLVVIASQWHFLWPNSQLVRIFGRKPDKATNLLYAIYLYDSVVRHFGKVIGGRILYPKVVYELLEYLCKDKAQCLGREYFE